jgi:hypothetical protein
LPRLEPELGADEHILVLLGGGEDAPPGFRLGPSRLSVGAGDSDDVFLSGVGVVPGHLQVVFVDGRITLLSATQEVRLSGQTVAAFPTDWLPGQVLSLSPDTHLAYGEAGATWPRPVPWDVEPDGDVNPEPAGTLDMMSGHDGMAADAHTAMDGDAGRQMEPLEAEADAAPPRFQRASPSTKQAMSRSARMVASALALSALLITGMAVADLSFGEREVVNPGDQAIARASSSLSAFLAQSPADYTGVEITRREDGAVYLTGFVEQEEAYRRLAERVRQEAVESDGNVRIDVMTPRRLIALVRDHLARFPLDSRVDVKADEVSLVVFGVELEADVMDRLATELGRLGTRLKPRTMKVVFQLATPDVFFNEVAIALNKSPATRDMQFTIGDEGGVITGLVAAPVESEARTALAEVKKSFEGRLPLQVDLRVDPKLNFRVVSLTLGGNQSTATLMQRGKTQTFQLGDPVFGTGELREIKNDGVVVALGRREMFIPLLR